MDVGRGFSTLGCSLRAHRLGALLAALAIGGAPLAAAPARPQAAPAAGAALAPAPPAAAPERVLDVTFFQAGQGSAAADQAPAERPQPASRRALAPPQAPGAAATRLAGAKPGGSGGGARTGGSAGGGLLAGTAAAVLVLAGGRLAWHRRPRRCAGCGSTMRRLGPEAAFAELDMAERTEHLVGDVRYQVWRCAGCGEVAKLGSARDLSRLKTGAGGIAAPVGSAAFLRRRAQSGLSIWSPPAPTGKAWPKPLVVPPVPQRLTAMPAAEPRPAPPQSGGEAS